MPCFGSWNASEKITAILPTGTLAAWAAARGAETVPSRAIKANKNNFLLIISILLQFARQRCRRPHRSQPAAYSGNLVSSLWLRRQGCGGRRVLTIEFGDKCFGDVERTVSADDALHLGDIENQGDAMDLGKSIEGLAD